MKMTVIHIQDQIIFFLLLRRNDITIYLEKVNKPVNGCGKVEMYLIFFIISNNIYALK